MKPQQKTWIIVILLFGILSVSDVLALGVAPGKQTIDFQSGTSKQLRLLVVNNDHQNFKALISVKGELADYVTLYDSVITFEEDDDQKQISYTLTMPGSFKTPGVHEAEIVVTMLPLDVEETSTILGAYPSISTRLQVRVPYPDKYLDSEFQILDTDLGDTTSFVIILSNYGTEDIIEAKANIIIYDSETNEKMLEFETNTQSLKPNQLRKLLVNKKLDLTPGAYKAVAILEYDGIKKRLEEQFVYGSVKVDIKSISLNNFKLGTAVPFDIVVQNLWGQPVQDVFAEVIVRNPTSIISEFKTITVDVPPLSYETITGYWDTKEVVVGNYLMEVILHYGNKVSSKSFNVTVSIDDAKLSPVGKVTSAENETSKIDFSIVLLMVLVLFLVGVNVALFLYIKKVVKK